MKSTDVSDSEVYGLIAGIAACVIVFLIFVALNGWYIIPSGNRGVLFTLGKAESTFKAEGFGVKLPFLSHVKQVSIKQQSREVNAACFSQDLQQVAINTRTLYRIPEENVVKVLIGYNDIYADVIEPKLLECLKEVTALRSAEQIAKTREEIKAATLKHLKDRLLGIVEIDDVVLVNIDLSDQLEHAIEQKMVQEQEAGRAKFSQKQAEIEAETARIRAKGEADAIKIRSEALQQNQKIVDLMIVEKWDGKAPQYVGGNSGAGILLPAAGK